MPCSPFYFYLASCNTCVIPGFPRRVFFFSVSWWKSQNRQVESWRKASSVPLFTVCLTLIHCLNVNAINKCCIYLMLQCMSTPASLSAISCIMQSVFAEMTSILLCYVWDCPHPPPQIHFCSVLYCTVKFLVPTVLPWRCTQANPNTRATDGYSAAATALQP